ncbi:hypothetical protein M9458_054052, partial [Cirrhinus mrigala]
GIIHLPRTFHYGTSGMARHPGPSAISRPFGGVRSLDAPFLDPRGHHGLLRRGALGILTAAVMRLLSHQVCLITRRQTWMFRRPSSSHTPTPVGSLVKVGDYRRGEADN